MVNFSGTVASDFLKLGTIPELKKSNLIDFAGTDFLTIKNNLLNYIQAVYPLDYSNFSESDLGIMLVEIVAYMGAVMSMKADILANENYLLTVQDRNNLNKILQLLGVSLKGPLSAAANAQFILSNYFIAPTSSLTITVDKRVITINSPEDGGPLNYTLYKVTNGLLDFNNNNTDIILNGSEAQSSSIFANLALQEGSLVVQTGQFAPTESIQTVALNQGPIIEGSVQVFVNGPLNVSGIYREVPNIYYASGGGDKIFQKVYDDNFRAILVFGDNTLGTAPTPNSSYTIVYRVGGGSRGNIRNNVINAVIQANLNNGQSITGNIQNISLATGGADSETVAHAKRYAPYTFRRQDRLVTGEDFSEFTNNFVSQLGTMGKGVAAVRKAYSSANIIDVYVLEIADTAQLQKASVQYKSDLLNAMEPKKMITDEIVVVDGVVRGLDLVISVRIDQELNQQQNQIKLKVNDAVVNFFNVDDRDFGEPFIIAEFLRTLFEIPEVRYSTVDNLDSDITVDFNEFISLNNLTINIVLV